MGLLPPPPLKSPLFCRASSLRRGGDGHKTAVRPPPWGGGGAPHICTTVSQCKSASATWKNFFGAFKQCTHSNIHQFTPRNTALVQRMDGFKKNYE